MPYQERLEAARDILSRLDRYPQFKDAAEEFYNRLPDEFPNRESARNCLKRLRDKSEEEEEGTCDDPSVPQTDFAEDRKNGTASFNYRGALDRPMTVDELLKVHGVDLDKWEVDRLKVNKWGVTSKLKNEDGDDVLQAAQNYQIAAWLVRKRDKPEVLLEAAADEIIATVSQIVRSSPKSPTRSKHPAFHTGESDPKRMLEVSIFDLHMGKLAWSKETGHGDWDSKIAASAALEAAEDLLTFFPNYGRIWLPLGHDFFNSDGPGESDSGGRTTKGTPQDEDTRWAKSLNTGVDLALALVERCKQFAPVDVMIMRGNHDEQRCVFMGRLLAEVYKNDPHVTVDDGLGMLKGMRWGNVFLATCHGQLESQQKVVTECAIKFPEFGTARWREIHTGHGHRMKSAGMVIDGIEEQSVRWRMIPSLCESDSYHARHLYHNNPAAESYLWHKDDLYEGHHSHNSSRA